MTDATQLAESFLEFGCTTKVIGVLATIHGDLKNQFVGTDVGFDSTCKVYSHLMSNICTDVLSSEKTHGKAGFSTRQQQALVALQNIRRGQTEDITSYVRRFRTVCTRFVGDLLNDGTIRHYSIQGLDSASTICEILTRRAMTLETAIQAALEIEVIDKENERMVWKVDEPILTFILVHHHVSELPSYQGTNHY